MNHPEPQAAGRLNDRRLVLTELIVERHFQRHPELESRYGAMGRVRCREDAAFHLSYLAQSLAAGTPNLFVDYIARAKVMLAARHVSAMDLVHHLEVMRDVIRQELPSDVAAGALEYVDAAFRALPSLAEDTQSLLVPDAPLATLCEQYISCLLRYDRSAASKLVLDAVTGGTSIRDGYEHVFARVQREIGRLWQVNKVTVAEEHYCTAATQLIISQLYPYLFASQKNGRMMVGMCTPGDLHEIGVRMVCDFFEMEGWDTIYLGANVPISSAVQMLRTRKPDILAASATIPLHVAAVQDLIAAVRTAPELNGMRIIVGGYAFRTPELRRAVEADAFGKSAAEAITIAQSFFPDAQH